MLRFALLVCSARALQLQPIRSGLLETLHAALQPSGPIVEETIDLGGGASGTVRGFEAADRAVAWCAATVVDGGDGTGSTTVAAWNAPTVDAPHFYARAAVEADAIVVEVDFRSRLDAGYDSAVEASGGGAYPEPDSRGAFARKALRSEYDGAYFDAGARAERGAVLASAGADIRPSPYDGLRVEGRRQYGGDDAGMAQGPLALSIALPRDATGAEAAAGAIDAAAARWLGWMADPPDATWMRTRLVYDRDCLVRQALAARASADLGARYGAAGRDLAAAEAGRLDMMGHNMMQENTGFGDDNDEGRD